ncbi:Zinc transporter ZIP4 [Seminavis robusta]|uniref:Zinc transporter ZIP4 n=1 Tax=Seminavis robusta TaxID=568900 RepID=A0A9N8D6L5_9STRA|nr:Zinc transporter ZIP4 [Seminavis robusta]|eukprot:Sro2_g001460.1 Zinc transporter ZIP4 (792) ;mRNA; f:158538-161188
MTRMALALLQLFLSVLFLSHVTSTSVLEGGGRSIGSFLSSIDTQGYSRQRNLQESEDLHDDHEHDHLDDSQEQLAASFQWAGIFHLEPQVYSLAVKVPEEGDSHAGHNHFRRLQNDGRVHSSHAEATSFHRLLAGDDPNGCHCDGTLIHCSASEAEAYCECHEHDGVTEVHCQEVDPSCHCDGSSIHCSNGDEAMAEAICDCHDGNLECSGGEEDDHATAHSAEVDPSCHCDGSAIHCSSGDEAMAQSMCHCHDGNLECSGGDHKESEEYHFLMALIPVSGDGQDGIEQAIGIVSDMSKHEDAIMDVSDGDTIIPSTDNAYEMLLVGESVGALSINITQQYDTVNGTVHFVLFLPGNPSQVEAAEQHFLVDEQGGEVWPETIKVLQKTASTSDPREGKDKPWGTVIGATLLVNLVTLSGVIFLVPTLSTAFRRDSFKEVSKRLWTSADPIMENVENRRVFDMGITSFACGALLATTFFLIVPEAMFLVNSRGEEEDPHAGHDHRMLQEDSHEGHDHGDSTWIFGTCVLAGFLLPMFLASFFPHHSHGMETAHVPVDADPSVSKESEEAHDIVDVDAFIESSSNLKADYADVISARDDVVSSDNRNKSGEEEEELKVDIGSKKGAEGVLSEQDRPPVNWRLVSAIILGDALHNFADGIFIGVGFLLCGNTVGWSILASTIYHELAQEVSDFFLLTEHAHLPPFRALVLNFASGLSVTLGAIVVLASDVSNFAIGVILSMSAGIYISVAAKECMPTVDRLAETMFDRALAFCCFALGAIPIGLVLLNHGHCEE